MISMNKKYRTRDGQDVRVLCVDREDTQYPVVVMLGNRSVNFFDKNGHYLIDQPSFRDLIEVKPEVIKWANMYVSGPGLLCDSKEGCDRQMGPASAGRTGYLKFIYIDDLLTKVEYEPI